MPRKTAKPAAPTRRMIWIDRDVHHAAKIRAAENSLTVREITERALTHYLDLGDAARRLP